MAQSITLKKNQDLPISALAVKGFKSISNRTEIELKPLTILAGANSSGKSSMIQPLLLKQTLECPYDPGPLKIDGPNVNFTSTRQILSREKTKSVQNFIVEFVHIKGLSVSINFVKAIKKGNTFDIDDIQIKRMSYVESFKPNMTFEQFKKNEKIKEVISEFINEYENCKFEITRNRFLYKFVLNFVPDNEKLPFPVVNFDPLEPHANIIRELIHLPGLRGSPERKYPSVKADKTYPGQFQNYFAGIIASWIDKKDKRLDKLCEWLDKLGLTDRVSANYLDDSSIEILVGRKYKKTDNSNGDLVSIADVGFGVSQVMPVLVAMLVSEPGQLVYIEQPELHLHPKAQMKLAELIAETAKRKVILIIETHSSLLLKTIQALIAEKKLSKDLVKLHWFTRQEDGSSKVYSGTLDKKGAYGDWPEDFSTIDMESEKRFLDAALD